MKKNNIAFTVIVTTLFIGSIYFYFSYSSKIKDTKKETQAFKIQLKSLKAENQTLTKVHSQLLERNSKVSATVNKLENIIN